MGSNDSRWSWPDALDALAAAPEHHRLLLENEHVRVLETLIPAGQTTAIHTHRWPNVQYIVSGTDFVRRDDQGTTLVDSRADRSSPQPGAVLVGALATPPDRKCRRVRLDGDHGRAQDLSSSPRGPVASRRNGRSRGGEEGAPACALLDPPRPLAGESERALPLEVKCSRSAGF
jgi:hypothetical protein